MVESTGLILGLIGPASFFAYVAFKLDDRHAVMRMFLVSWGWIFMLGVPVIGSAVAKANNLPGVRKVFDIALLPMIFGFIFWSFYLIILYFTDVGKTLNREKDQFDNEF